MSDARMFAMPHELRRGDVVTPTSGRWEGKRCEVITSRLARLSHFSVDVVPIDVLGAGIAEWVVPWDEEMPVERAA